MQVYTVRFTTYPLKRSSEGLTLCTNYLSTVRMLTTLLHKYLLLTATHSPPKKAREACLKDEPQTPGPSHIPPRQGNVKLHRIIQLSHRDADFLHLLCDTELPTFWFWTGILNFRFTKIEDINNNTLSSKLITHLSNDTLKIRYFY